MPGPWEDYAPAKTSGPWEDYGGVAVAEPADTSAEEAEILSRPAIPAHISDSGRRADQPIPEPSETPIEGGIKSLVRGKEVWFPTKQDASDYLTAQLEAAEQQKAGIEGPLIHLPRPELSEEDSKWEQFWKGTLDVAAGTAEALTTPENINLMASLRGAPRAFQRAVMAALSAEMAKHTPELIRQAKKAETVREKTSAYGNLGVNTLMAAGGAKFAATKPKAGALPKEATAPKSEDALGTETAPDIVAAGTPDRPVPANAETPVATPDSGVAKVAGEEPKGIAASAREKFAQGEQGGFINIQPAIDALDRKRKAILNLGRSIENRNIMDQTFDAADTQATVAGQQSRKSLDIGTTPIERQAAMAIVEANGNPANLQTFLAQSVHDPKAESAVRYAQANWTRLQPLAQRVKSLLDAQIQQENNAGISTEYHEAYVPHIYDTDLWMGAGRPYVLSGKSGGGVASGFKKGRTFNTIFEAISAGLKPKSMDVGELVEHRIKIGQRMINRKAWADSLRNITDPSNNEPIVTSMVHKTRGPGQPGYEVAPTGYSPREILPGVRIAVHEGYSPLFDALTGTSRVSGNAAGNLALQVAGGIKHGLLAFDSFHAGRMMMRELFLTGKVSYKKGQSLLEYSNADLTRAVNEGLISPEIAQWANQNRPTADLLIKNGLNVGRVQEALYNNAIRKVPGIGHFNKWVFEKLTRGAMMQSALIEFERVSQAMPNLNREQVARKVARDLNVYFGNLGSQGIFKSRTFQDIARLTFLAPNWVESMARTEIKGALQTAKGLTYDPIVHKTLMTGSVGKGVAQGVLAMFVGAQILNLVTRGKPTWENEEEGHKLDAWIPDATGKSPGFFVSPFSVQAEITHDLLRYGEAEPSPSRLAVAARVGMNKTSPFFRAGKVLLTGQDWDKKKLTDDWSRAKAAAFALAPTPIPLSTLTKENAPPGALQRQLTASIGIKTEPAPTANQQIFQLQRKWMEKNPDPKIRHQWEQRLQETFPESDYKRLRDALRSNDLEAAKAEYKKLVELKKKRSDIIQAMHPKRPILSHVQDAKFVKTLTPEQKAIYKKAQDERMVIWKRFQQIKP